MRVPLLAVLPLVRAQRSSAPPNRPPESRLRRRRRTLAPAEMTAILQKTATLRLAPDLSHLTAGERAAVNHLLQVGGILQRLYEEARHPSAERERHRLLDEARTAAGRRALPSPTPRASSASSRARSPPPSTTGASRSSPSRRRRRGRTSTPPASPPPRSRPSSPPIRQERPSILGERTVVRRATAEALAADLDTLQRVPLVAGLHPFLAGKLAALAEHPDPQVLYAVPQAVAWARPLTTAYLSLHHAADAVAADDAEFAGYLRNRARDLLSNDYESGDAAWVTGRFGRLNAQIGSYETYDDALFGVKAFPSMSLLLRDEAATAELAKSLGSLQEIEDALPYSPKKRVRPEIPIGVYEVIADFGQARGTNTATNLPNDPLFSRRYGRIILMRANIMKNPDLFANARAALERGDRARLPRRARRRRRQWRLPAHPLARDRALPGSRVDARRPRPRPGARRLGRRGRGDEVRPGLALRDAEARRRAVSRRPNASRRCAPAASCAS